MKLRNLKGAIRKVDGPLKAVWNVETGSGDNKIVVSIVKSDLITALDQAFGDDGQTETTMRVRDGFIEREPSE